MFYSNPSPAVKKLDKLLIKSYIGPLFLTFSIALFVLLMNFLWKSITELVGKGLDGTIILELLFYASATFVPLALPLAILLASIMTMGNLGERYELVAMKAAGIPLWRILRGPIWLSMLIALFAFYFSNNVMPVANLKFKTLFYEVRTKKPAVNIRPNEFYSEIDGYVIRIGSKSKDGKRVEDVLIYDHRNQTQGSAGVTYAKSGMMYGTDSGQYLFFELEDGFSFANEKKANAQAGTDRMLTRIYFKKQVKRFDLSSFAFMQNAKDRYSDDYRMMNLSQLSQQIDSLKYYRDLYVKEAQQYTHYYLHHYEQTKNTLIPSSDYSDTDFYTHIHHLNTKQHRNVYNKAMENARIKKEDASHVNAQYNFDSEFIWHHEIEWHRKFTLSVACIILFFIGAPLGAIIRKGGLGTPVVVSTLAFIIYYVIGVLGEKAAKEGAITPGFGMWISGLVFLPLGLFLTIKSTKDSTLLNIDAWKELLMSFINNKIRKSKKAK